MATGYEYRKQEQYLPQIIENNIFRLYTGIKYILYVHVYIGER